MLERYFVRPRTVDRIRDSWLGPAIEQYATWLIDHGHATRNLAHRVPILVQFGTFAATHGATRYEDLPALVDPFVEGWITRTDHRRVPGPPRPRLTREIRGPIEQMLRVVIPDFVGHTRRRAPREPFADRVAGFFAYLRDERGLREETIAHYGHHLRPFDTYLRDVGVIDLQSLCPVLVSGFITDRSRHLQRTGVRDRCGVLRVFLRYLHRQGVVGRDLSVIIEAPPVYRLATIPRSITWDEVRQLLDTVDRRTVVGRRDYGMLLLLVTYGLRAREVAALTLDDVDWRHDRLRVPERKAGHSTAYPLSPLVGQAIVEYLKAGRPTTSARQIFFRTVAPFEPITHSAVSCRAAHYLRQAGIAVPRPGSHTLRHTCVQRLVDAGWPLKPIGDYVGHRSPGSTEIYSKVAVETLRDVACGGKEEII
jgi:site-specific recombinase XerD